MKKLLARTGALLLVSLTGGCHWLAGNPDAVLNGAVLWRNAEPFLVDLQEADRSVWIRIESPEALRNTVRVLSGRLQQQLATHGWRVASRRDDAEVWLDLAVRYQGINPARDEGASTYGKVLRDRRPDVLAEGETVRGGRFAFRSLLTPAEAVISRLLAEVVEYDLLVDVYLRHRGQAQECQTLVVWVRKIDLDEREAAVALQRRALDALGAVFGAR